MPAQVAIPNGIFSIGSSQYGPLALAVGDDACLVTLDRTVNQGLNSKTTATKVTAAFEMSLPDDPATWIFVGGGTFDGGIRTDPELGQLNTDYLGMSLFAADQAGRQLRLTLTVAGSTVRLAGTVKVGTNLTVT